MTEHFYIIFTSGVWRKQLFTVPLPHRLITSQFPFGIMFSLFLLLHSVMQKLTPRVSPFYLKLHVNHKSSCKPIVVTMVDAKMTEFAQSHVLRWTSPAMVTPCPAASDTVWVEEKQSRTRLGAFFNLHHVFFFPPGFFCQ